MNAKQDYALAVLTKQAALSAEDWRTIGTYAVPTLAGAGIGALAYRKNRLLGALLGGGAGAGLGALADYGYKKYLESLSKKELRKKLKKIDIDPDNMSRSEMIETLDLYI